jgi:hypothetical protein
MVAEVPKKNAGGGMFNAQKKKKGPAAMPGLSALATRQSVLFAHGRISQIFPMRNPSKADANLVPILGTAGFWFSSREPDIREVVNPSIY